MADDAGFGERGGNLYSSKTLQGNWWEDREQRTFGAHDGLRSTTRTFEQAQDVSQARNEEAAVSVPLFAGDDRAVGLATATRYRRVPSQPTDRVISQIGAESFSYTSTSRADYGNQTAAYRDSAHKRMIDQGNLQEAMRPRVTNRPEFGYGAVVPRKSDDDQKWYGESTLRSEFIYKDSSVAANQPAAGFTYDRSVQISAIPQSAHKNAVDPWGNTKESKAGHFGEHHITSTTRMFVDQRGIDPPRLAITNPEDGDGPPLPLPSAEETLRQSKAAKAAGTESFGRVSTIARAPADMAMVGGRRVFFDD